MSHPNFGIAIMPKTNMHSLSEYEG